MSSRANSLKRAILKGRREWLKDSGMDDRPTQAQELFLGQIHRLATDCSGLDAPIFAAEMLGLRFTQAFASDTDSVARCWLENLHHAESIHANMLERPEERLPSEGEVGGYALGFPCQPFSRLAGKTRRGFQDPRSAVFYGGLRTLMILLPAWAVLENVRGILSHKIPLDPAFRTAGVFQKYWAILVPLCPQETLKEPHRRPRVYILLARKDRCLVGGTEQLQELVATMYHEVAHSMECLDVRELLDPETPGWTEQDLAEVQGGNGTKWITQHNAKRLEVGLQPVAHEWKAGFTPRSWSTMEIWQEVYKTNVEPVFCDLSQNLHRCPIGEGFLPCLTTSAQVCVLNTKHGPRRLTAVELLAFQGFPVEKKSFQQLVQGFDAAKLRFMAGNTMHVRCVGMAMLMAMCLLGWPSGPKSVPPDQSKNQTGILVMTGMAGSFLLWPRRSVAGGGETASL